MSVRLVGDCASDPPLGATARGLGTARADDVVIGLGLVAVARRAEALALSVRDPDARAALAKAIERVGAQITIVEPADAWPVRVAAGEERVSAEALVCAADAARGRAARRYVTIAGAVATPIVRAVDAGVSVAQVVAEAGPLVDDWLPVAGGAPAGRLVAREAPVDDSLILVLPARHEIVRRLRTPLADWLLRAVSACEGCRLCSDGCPTALGGAPLRPHEAIATLASLRDDGTALTHTLACTGCGLCDAICPSSLSPRALMIDVRDRLHANGLPRTAPGATDGGLDRALLTLRLGLQPYDAPVALRL